jgi:hypothetical protein
LAPLELWPREDVVSKAYQAGVKLPPIPRC